MTKKSQVYYKSPEHKEHFQEFFFEKYKDLVPYLEKIGIDFSIAFKEDGCFYFDSETTGELNLSDAEVVNLLKTLGSIPPSSTIH